MTRYWRHVQLGINYVDDVLYNFVFMNYIVPWNAAIYLFAKKTFD